MDDREYARRLFKLTMLACGVVAVLVFLVSLTVNLL
jgi:hypothetical protein